DSMGTADVGFTRRQQLLLRVWSVALEDRCRRAEAAEQWTDKGDKLTTENRGDHDQREDKDQGEQAENERGCQQPWATVPLHPVGDRIEEIGYGQAGHER